MSHAGTTLDINFSINHVQYNAKKEIKHWLTFNGKQTKYWMLGSINVGNSLSAVFIHNGNPSGP